MPDLGSSERFEILADLFRRRYGFLPPGKYQSPACPVDYELRQVRWNEWINSDLPLEDAIKRIARLEEKIEKMEANND